MKYCLVFYDPGTWNTLLEEVNVCVCWVGGVCCWWSSSDKGKVAFYQNSIISMEGGWGLGGVGCLFFSQVKIWREVGDLVAFMFLWCDKRQLTGETERSDFVLCLPVQGSDFGADFLKTLALWPNNVHWFLQKTAQNSLHSRQLGGD